MMLLYKYPSSHLVQIVKPFIITNMKQRWSRITTSIIHYLSLHLFLSLVSLPIIAAWGLPSSWLSPLGNFLFNPFISFFLFISSIAFFSELMGIPHVWCNWLLEQLTTMWHWILPLAPTHVLYGFYQVPLWILSTITFITLVTVMHPRMRHPFSRFIVLLFFFASSMIIIGAHEPSSSIYPLPCRRGSVFIIRTNTSTIVIDPGYIGSHRSAPSWISYTFMPALIAHTGSLTIDHLIILKPTSTSCEALHTLLDNAYVKHIYFPLLTGELMAPLKQSFGKLYAHIKKDNIPLTRIDTRQSIVGSPPLLLIKPTGTLRKYHTITYPHTIIEGTIADTQLTIEGR